MTFCFVELQSECSLSSKSVVDVAVLMETCEIHIFHLGKHLHTDGTPAHRLFWLSIITAWKALTESHWVLYVRLMHLFAD